MIQYGIAALEKDLAILFGLRPVLDHLGSSASINITLREYSRALSSHRRFDAARLTGQHAEFLLLSRRATLAVLPILAVRFFENAVV